MTAVRLGLVPWMVVMAMIGFFGDPAFAEAQRESRTLLQQGRSSVLHPSDLDVIRKDLHSELALGGYRDDSGQPLGEGLVGRDYGLDPRYRRVWITAVALDVFIDNDADAFYQGFRMSLDFSVTGGAVRLYSKLYLSYEGGPWNFVHRSREFRVSPVAFVNEFEMTTLLDSGYPTGYYDLRIDLFDADTGRWIFGYGPYDSWDFSSIPLEDQWRDGLSPGVGSSLGYDVSLHGGGSLGGLTLGVSALLLFYRRSRSMRPKALSCLVGKR